MSTTSNEPSDTRETFEAEPPSSRREIQRPMMIDRFMPAFDVGKIRHRVVNATAIEAWEALRGMDFSTVRSPLLQLGLALHRQARKRALELRGAKRTNIPRRLTFDNLEDYGRIKLAEEPGFEILVGAIAELARPRVSQVITVEEFLLLERPGYVKGVASFSVRPYGATRSLVSYEARARADDQVTRQRFRRSWRIFEPVVTILMDSVLNHIARTAERKARSDRAEAA